MSNKNKADLDLTKMSPSTVNRICEYSHRQFQTTMKSIIDLRNGAAVCDQALAIYLHVAEVADCVKAAKPQKSADIDRIVAAYRRQMENIVSRENDWR